MVWWEAACVSQAEGLALSHCGGSTRVSTGSGDVAPPPFCILKRFVAVLLFLVPRLALPVAGLDDYIHFVLKKKCKYSCCWVFF